MVLLEVVVGYRARVNKQLARHHLTKHNKTGDTSNTGLQPPLSLSLSLQQLLGHNVRAARRQRSPPPAEVA